MEHMVAGDSIDPFASCELLQAKCALCAKTIISGDSIVIRLAFAFAFWSSTPPAAFDLCILVVSKLHSVMCGFELVYHCSMPLAECHD